MRNKVAELTYENSSNHEEVNRLRNDLRALRSRMDIVADDRDSAKDQALSYKAKFEEWFAKARECNQELARLRM